MGKNQQKTNSNFARFLKPYAEPSSRLLALVIFVFVNTALLTAYLSFLAPPTSQQNPQNQQYIFTFFQQYILKLFYAIPIWGTILILLVLGFVLYWIRSRLRWQYGFIEYSIGFVTSLNVFLPLGFDYSQLKPLAVLQVLGGAYIMVRGIDNFSIGIQGTWFEKYWKRIFGKRST